MMNVKQVADAVAGAVGPQLAALRGAQSQLVPAIVHIDDRVKALESGPSREILDAIKEAVAPLQAENASLRAQIEVLKARIDERPMPKDGKDGINGKDGTNGKDGERGQDGRDGKDAPPVDVDALFARLKAEIPALIPAPLKGDKGDRGEKGEPGLNGRDGVDGRDGENGKGGRDGIDGKNGADGRDGKDGRDGINGKDGRDGLNGKDGAAGRDASALEYVTIDEVKSYPRGTLGLHKGGLWLADRPTEKMDGWRCISPGLAGIKSNLLSDGRTFEFTFERSDGTAEVQKVKVAVPKHCGVWREAIAYEPGDCVQWSGNAWIAREVTSEKPGEGKGWELLARRGRDGKDA